MVNCYLFTGRCVESERTDEEMDRIFGSVRKYSRDGNCSDSCRIIRFGKSTKEFSPGGKQTYKRMTVQSLGKT